MIPSFRSLIPLAALLAAPAQAEDTYWQNVSGWDVAFYEADQGCSASTTFEGGITFYFGLASDPSGLYLTILMTSQAWRSIQPDTSYDITVRFGRRSPWNLDMTGGASSLGPTLNFLHSAKEQDARRFIGEFRYANSMEWTYNGTSLGRLSLKGSNKAFEAVIECTDAFLLNTGRTPGDPFK